MSENKLMPENNKRSYTVPILLILIIVLLTLIIIFYSKLILTQQTQTTDQGKRLAEQYVYAQVFADRLHNGVDGLLNAKSETDRIRAARMLGEANIAAGEASGLLTEASHLDSGKSKEEAAKQVVAAINTVMGVGSVIATIGEHEGPLTKVEIAALSAIRDGAEKMKDALNRFRPPTGEAGFRQMVTVSEWINPALDATKALEDFAANLK
jgi:hypothetical protein